MTFKGDKWNKVHGYLIPIGSTVELIKYMPRRKVLISYQGDTAITQLWCLKRDKSELSKGMRE